MRPSGESAASRTTMRLVLWAAQSLNPSRMRVWKGICSASKRPSFSERPSSALRRRARFSASAGPCRAQRSCRPEAADGHVVERAQFFDVEAAPVALIDHGGVRVAVAEYHLAAFQRRADDLRDVLRPVREEQEQFRLRADFRFRIQEHLAQLPAQRAPAGLARHQHLMVQGAEHVGEVLDERGFARALNAF